MSGREALRPPAPVRLADVMRALVQAVRATLPELDHVRAQEVAAPPLRARDLGAGEALLGRAQRLVELLARAEHAALPRRPRPQPRAAAARGEVRVGLLRGQPLDRALEPQLALQRRPPQRERGARVRVELAALAAAVVREEADAAPVDPPHEHEAHGRAAVRGRRGERHALGLGHARLGRLREPAARLRERAHSRFIATYLTSRYSLMPSAPPSRPKPDCLTPPNGAAGLDTRPWLRPTIPVSSPSTTRNARLTSLVKT